MVSRFTPMAPSQKRTFGLVATARHLPFMAPTPKIVMLTRVADWWDQFFRLKT
jgi:hypothetical protein